MNVTTIRIVNQTDVDRINDAIASTVKWLKDKEAEFKAQAENVDPVVSPSDISFRCEMVRSQAAKVLRAPRRPLPTNSTNSSGNSASGSKPTSEPEEKAQEDAEKDEDVQ